MAYLFLEECRATGPRIYLYSVGSIYSQSIERCTALSARLSFGLNDAWADEQAADYNILWQGHRRGYVRKGRIDFCFHQILRETIAHVYGRFHICYNE